MAHVRRTPRLGGRPLRDASLLSSTSPPASTTPETTSGGASSLTRAQLQQLREGQLRHALQHTSPSPAEVCAVASPAYVQALMELIDQHSEAVQRVSDAVDTLREQREARYAEVERGAQHQEEELQQLRNERSDLALQVQEERERCTRLLHENTVLHAKGAEQRDQLGRLAELCRARGQRLRAGHGEAAKGNGGGGGASHARRWSVENGSGTSPLPMTLCDAAAAPASKAAEPFDGVREKAVDRSTAAASSLSLSIHRAVDVAAAASQRHPGASRPPAALDGVADDAEVAALLSVPYKLQVPHTPSSPLTHSTVTANTAATTHMLALNEEVNMLRQQLEEQRITYEQERGLRSREDDEQHRRHLEMEAKYRLTMEQLQALHEESLSELVQYRHATEKQMRDVRGQVEWLRAALQEALELAEKDRRRQHNEVYATEQRVTRQYYPKVQSLQAELEECRRSAVAQTRDHARLLSEKDALVMELQQRVKAEANQRRRIEERYALEMDGVHSELDLMRQSLRQMERRVYYRDVRDQSSEVAQMELGRHYA
ncbi:hypothetical protein NESM_000307400 [Novymonas esmeraldas]|uniref:Uncharacterized protein n=1 Tax=Novymonas esmeraldas TaxID=1808958 RepID=A0AAW0EKN6_9TRYP